MFPLSQEMHVHFVRPPCHNTCMHACNSRQQKLLYNTITCLLYICAACDMEYYIIEAIYYEELCL